MKVYIVTEREDYQVGDIVCGFTDRTEAIDFIDNRAKEANIKARERCIKNNTDPDKYSYYYVKTESGTAWYSGLNYIKIEETVINEVKPTKRYFIVFLQGAMNTGVALHIKTEGNYITMEDIYNAYSCQGKSKSNPVMFPTNIIELNESDYKDWVK